MELETGQRQEPSDVLAEIPKVDQNAVELCDRRISLIYGPNHEEAASIATARYPIASRGGRTTGPPR